MCLDNRGIPVIRPFHAIRLSGNLYREGMYAVKVVDNRLYPVVEKGTVVVVNPGEDISHTDIAVVSTAEETGLYRIIRFRRNTYVIETLQPYSYRLLEQKDIRYISRITIIIRKELP
jgi:SOS-response transcriptional repressor LexA